MLPSNLCNQNVKLRHRNDVTATTTVGLPAGGQRNSSRNPDQSEANSVKEKHWDVGCSSSKHFDFFSNLSSDEYECYMTHRRQTLSESSDDSQTNDTALIGDCSKYIKKSSNNLTATMRPNDLQRQTSISHMNNVTGGNPRCSKSRTFNLLVEVAIRVMLIASFVQMERATAFKRIIHPEEIWLYKNPVSKEYVPASVILVGVISAPLVLIIGSFLLSRDRKDFIQASYAFTLAIGLNGFLTSLIKISVGRPRPDFFFRCYPDGVMLNNFDHCTGDPQSVNEGRKSFPSGHSSMAFAGFGFMFFYLASKLHIFNDRGRGHTWRLCIAIAPLIVATEVAISRTCDYRHHWQDVLVGSLIGICITYISYRQYFPSIFARNCHRSYPRSARISTNQVNCFVPATGTEEPDENQPLIGGEKDNKWI